MRQGRDGGAERHQPRDGGNSPGGLRIAPFFAPAGGRASSLTRFSPGRPEPCPAPPRPPIGRRPSGLRPPRPALREPALERCLWAQTIQTWITQPSRGPWAVPAPQWRQRLTPRAAQRGPVTHLPLRPPAQSMKRRGRSPLLAFLVSARVSLGQPRYACGFLFAGVSGYRKSQQRRKFAQTVSQVTASYVCGRHPGRSETAKTNARLCHRCRNGSWSGRGVGRPGAVRGLRSRVGRQARVHVVKGHVARSA